MHDLVRFAADGLLIVVILVGAASILWKLRSSLWLNMPVCIMAALTSLLSGKLLSLLYQPTVARPFLERGLEPGAAYINNPGFPSDHALLATVVVVAVYYVTKSLRLTVFLIFLTVIMCSARVVALVHTPLDILGGMIAGISGIIWYRKLTK